MTEEVIDGEAVEIEASLPVVSQPHTSTALVARDEIDVAELVAQSEVIYQAMKQAMTDGVHYGRIPGVDKPTLLKPGAEKLLVLFRLAPAYESEKIWHDDGHLTVTVKCILHHIPTGLKVAEGEGLCTTKESRYAWRKGGRLCPECQQPAIIKGKAEYGGGWLCFAKKGGCGAKWSDDDPQAAEFENANLDRVANPDLPDSYNCVTPETRVLTKDLRWVEAGDLVTGDVLIGVNEELPNRNGRRYEESIVSIGDPFTDELYEVKMEDGRSVRCNGEHRWLTKSVGFGVRWATTKEIHDDMAVNSNGKRVASGRPRKWSIMTVGSPWESDESHDGGYMAGLLDGEGCLSLATTSTYTAVNVLFAQQEGGVLRRYLSGLQNQGFIHKMYLHGNKATRKPVHSVVLAGGFLEVMRLLGSLRPPRLLEKWVEFDIGVRRFEGRPVLVESVTAVGRGELVRLGTSSRTYIAEGLVCHNTVLKMADKRALLAAVLNGTAASDVFTQDMEDARGDSAGGDSEAPKQESAAPKAFDPATMLRKDAPAAKRGWKGISETLMEVDPSLEWAPIIRQAISSVYGGDGDFRRLEGDDKKAAAYRAANAAGRLTELAQMETFLTEESIQKAFAEMFEGVVVDVPVYVPDDVKEPHVGTAGPDE